MIECTGTLCNSSVDTTTTSTRSTMEQTMDPMNVMDKEYEQYVHLGTIHDKTRNRIIPYATAGNSTTGHPVLFFPPLGGSRRMVLVLKEALQQHSLYAICISRPGSEKTIPPGNNPSSQVDIFCSDTITVMDALNIPKVGILCMCAGMTFGMAFCKKYPNRTTGKFLALGPWTLPADCPYSKRVERFAALHLPILGISSLVGSIQCTFMNFFSKDTIAQFLEKKSSDSEQQYLQQRYKNRTDYKEAFAHDLDWVMGAGSTSRNEKDDVAVCLSKLSDLGFTYADLIEQDIVIWQGSKDNIAYPQATEWLAKQLPRATLYIIPDSTHQGALFLLGSEYQESLSHLKVK